MKHATMASLCCLLSILFGLLLCASPRQTCRGSLKDLNADAACILRSSGCVDRVERLVSPSRPTHRIIHIANIHYVDFDDFTIDVRDQYGDTITDAEIAADYDAWMNDIRRVQVSQRKLLRWLATKHGVERVYSEGLTDNDMPAYNAIIDVLSRREDDKESPVLMRLGAAGQLLIAGDLREVLPAEDEAAFIAADPLAGEMPVFEGPANDAREAAIVRRLLEGGPLSVIVLGASHDLSDEVRAVGNCEYLRVFVAEFPE